MGGGDSQGPPSAAKGMAACEDPDATAPGELVGEVDPTGTVTGMTCNSHSQSENMPGMAIYTTNNQKLWQEWLIHNNQSKTTAGMIWYTSAN